LLGDEIAIKNMDFAYSGEKSGFAPTYFQVLILIIGTNPAKVD
jgi:hypothetical protein